MRLFCVWIGITVLIGTASAAFEQYKVTDLGLPDGHPTNFAWLNPSKYSNTGVASAEFLKDPKTDQYLYKNGTWTLSNPPSGQIYPTESDWFGYGDAATSVFQAQAGYYRNGAFHQINPSNDWKNIACKGTSQTKYMFGGEALGTSSAEPIRPYVYDVTTGIKTFLPYLDGRDYVFAGLDTGVFAVGAGTHSTLPFLWKNGHYTQLGLESWHPQAISRTEYVAGAAEGGSDHVTVWHDGVDTPISLPTGGFSVTGVSDAGIVSMYSNTQKPTYLGSDFGTAKLDDLIVNKPADMTIYGASINYDGHMFGQAKVGNEHHFVLLDPVPEPGTWVVVGVGAVVLLRRKARG